MNSLGRLDAIQMRAYKKQRREGAPRGRYEWMKVKLLTERQRRCLERAWNRREAKVDKKFLDRKRYLAARTAELQVTVNECNSMMSKIRNAMFKDIGVLLAVRDGSDAAASAEPGKPFHTLRSRKKTRAVKRW